MTEEKRDLKKVLIISRTDSFLAQSLASKLEGFHIVCPLVHTEIGEVEENLEDAGLMLLFLDEELEEKPGILVYLKDVIRDNETGLIVIGDREQYEIVKKTITEQEITALFERPLNLDSLVESVTSYLDENMGEGRKKTVLIVDDDITYMRTVYEWLKGSYHVGMAANGVQAIRYLARSRPDLILLDYEMPVADGPRVLTMLKSEPETGEIPVMFLTSHGDRKSVLSVAGLNPVDYLLKTIDRETLLKKLSDHFEKASAAQS